MNLSRKEKSIQKKLTVLSIACFATAFIFPPAALAGGAILLGQAGRAYKNRHSEDNEEPAEKDKVIPYYKSRDKNSFIPESPETAISRRDPRIGRGVLEEISRNILYSKIASQAEETTRQYLDTIRELNPNRIRRSRGVNVTFNQKQNQGLKRILFGVGDVGYELNINLIEE